MYLPKIQHTIVSKGWRGEFEIHTPGLPVTHKLTLPVLFSIKANVHAYNEVYTISSKGVFSRSFEIYKGDTLCGSIEHKGSMTYSIKFQDKKTGKTYSYTLRLRGVLGLEFWIDSSELIECMRIDSSFSFSSFKRLYYVYYHEKFDPPADIQTILCFLRYALMIIQQ